MELLGTNQSNTHTIKEVWASVAFLHLDGSYWIESVRCRNCIHTALSQWQMKSIKMLVAHLVRGNGSIWGLRRCQKPRPLSIHFSLATVSIPSHQNVIKEKTDAEEHYQVVIARPKIVEGRDQATSNNLPFYWSCKGMVHVAQISFCL